MARLSCRDSSSLGLRELDAGTQRTAATSDRIKQISNRSSRLETPSPGVTVVTVHAFGHGSGRQSGEWRRKGEANQNQMFGLARPCPSKRPLSFPVPASTALRRQLLPSARWSRLARPGLGVWHWLRQAAGGDLCLALAPFRGQGSAAGERADKPQASKQNETFFISLTAFVFHSSSNL